MNLKTLIEKQRQLDDRINQQHPTMDKHTRLTQKLLALQVELGELSNEWRGFKFWSNDQEPRREKLLEEYVDCLHFFLSIGIDLKIERCTYPGKAVNGDITELMNVLFLEVGILFDSISDWKYYGRNKRQQYIFTMQLFVTLAAMLGLSTEEVKVAYHEKHNVNLERQESGY